MLNGSIQRKENKEIVIFGAGTYGHQIYDILKCQGIDIALFCDNKKCGEIDEKTGLKVVDVDTLKRECENYLILLCVVDTKAYTSIEKQLIEAGFDSGYLRGMREYIESLKEENLEPPVFNFNGFFLTASFIIAGVAVFPFLYWNNVIFLMLVLFLLFLLNNSIGWVMKTFGKIEVQMVIYQMHSPLKGTGRGY